MVRILDLRSGYLRLTIDTGMEVRCLGVGGDTVVVVDREKIVTWSLPGGDGVRTVTLDGNYLSPSLSPDLSRIAASSEFSSLLSIYDATTGRCLEDTIVIEASDVGFTRDGREVWSSSSYSGINGWEIIEGGVSGAMKLKPLKNTLYPSRTFLWDSICGYKVADGGWVLSPTQKRLLWLPHRWREDRREYRLWSGRFLGLSHRLSEVVILEFLE